MMTRKELSKYNEENDEYNEMYNINLYRFRRGFFGDPIRLDDDPYIGGASNRKEAEKIFRDCVRRHGDGLVTIVIERASGVYRNCLEYEPVKKYTTLRGEKTK